MTIAVVSCVGFFTQILLWLVTFPFDRNRYIVGRLFRIMAVIVVKLAPTWKFSLVGKYPRKLGKTVVVSNHVSHADSFLISHFPWEMKWLGKAELLKIPFVGWNMFMSGDIMVKRGDKQSTQYAMARCKKYLENGMPICIFPEGTRSKDGNLQEFKDGAFRLAIETGANILPLAVAGTQDALPKHSWKFGFARATAQAGEFISTKGMTLADIETLKSRVREQIRQLQLSMAAQSRVKIEQRPAPARTNMSATVR